MSTTIDQKVVEMRFDNKQFQDGVSSTMSALDKLKNALSFTGATKGLDNLGDAIKKCDVSPIGSAVETVQTKFSALEVMAVTALVNITNSAVNAGKRIVSALTIEPITTGFKEYELKMGSVQTIMASTGEDIDTVNKYLEELNKYSDQTIYSFSDMTQNIGKFTNAGVKLEDAVQAIKGISNEAAVSGANAEEASRAMYNFAQALSAGYVKLIDWKSIENANMATKEFKQQLIDTAVASGTLAKKADGMYQVIGSDVTLNAVQNFNDSLKEEWMTTEVLTETLKKYADANTDIGKKAFAAAQDVKTLTQLYDVLKESAQSGWAQTWELLIGDLEEAKAVLSGASKFLGGIIDGMSNYRNKILGDALDASSGWEDFEKQLTDAGIASDDFQNKLIETARAHGIAIDKMIEEEGSFVATLKKGWLTTDIITATLNKFVYGSEQAASATKDMTDKLEYFQKVVDDVWRGDYANKDTGRFEKLKAAGYDYAKVQELVNKTVDGHRLTLEDLSDVQLESIGYTKDQIETIKKLKKQAEETGTPLNDLIEKMSRPSGRQLLIESFANAGNGLKKILDAIGTAWNEAFPAEKQSEAIYQFIKAIHKLTTYLNFSDDTVKDLTSTFRGLFAIIDIITTITGGAFKLAFKLLCKVLDLTDVNILDITASTGEAIAAFRDWLLEGNYVAKGIDKLLDIIATAIGTVKDWIEAFFEIPEVQATIENFRNKVEECVGNIKEYFKTGGEKIGEFIERIKSMDTITLADLPTIFKDFRDNVLSHFFDVELNLDGLKKAFEKFKDSLKTELEKAGVFLDEFKNNTVKVLGKIKDTIVENLGAIVAIGTGIGILATIKKVADVFEMILGPMDSLAGAIEDMGKGLKHWLDAKAFNEATEGLRNIAISILILAGSLWVIAQIPHEDLEASLKALGLLAAGLVIFAAAMVGLGKLGPAMTLGVGSIIALAAGILILVAALKVMEALNQDTLDDNIKRVIGMLVALGGVAAILSTFAPKLSKGSLMMVAMALSVKILASVLKDLDELTIGDPAKVMSLLFGFVIGMSLLMVSASNVKIGAAVTLIAAVVALKLIIESIKEIAKIDGASIVYSLAVITTVLGLFTALMLASNLAGKHAAQAGIALILVAGALLIITQVIKILSGMDPADIAIGLVAIGLLGSLFVAIIAVTNLAGKHAAKAGVTLIAMSVAMLLLSGVMWIIGSMPTEKLVKGLAAITVLGAVFAGIIAVTHLAQDVKGTLIVITVAIALLAVAIAALSIIEPKKLLSSSVALSLVITSFGTALYGMSKLGKVSKSAMVGVLLMTAVMAAAAGLLYLLKDTDPLSALANAVSLSVLMIAMAAALNVLQTVVNISNDALIGVVAMTAVMAAAAGCLNLLRGIDPLSAMGNAVALSVLMIAMAAALAIMQTVKTMSGGAMAGLVVISVCLPILAYSLAMLKGMDPEGAIGYAVALGLMVVTLSAALILLGVVGIIGVPALAGVGILAVLVAALAGIIIGLGALMEKCPEAEQFLNKGMPILEKLGYALGNFFGNIIAGFGDAVVQILPTLGTALSDFMTNAKPFIDEATKIDPSILEGIGALVGCVLLITGAEVLNGVLSLFGMEVDFEAFGNKLGALGIGVRNFAIATAGIDPEAVEKSASAAMVLVNLANSLPRYGGVIAEWFGDKMDLATFSDQICAFGLAIKSYSNVITLDKGIDADAVEKSAKAGMALSELANSLPRYGGVFAEWFGEKMDLTTFSSQICAFGRAIKAYSNTITVDGGIDANAVEASAKAGQALSDLANSLPRYGGKVAEWFGEKVNLNTFGIQICAFGKAIKDYSDIIMSDGGIDVAAVEGSVKAGTMLSDLANNLPTYGGAIAEWFTGEQVDLRQFGFQLKSFGESLRNYSKTITADGGLNYDAIEQSQKSAMLLTALANNLPDYKSDGILSNWFGGDLSIDDFGKQLVSFGRNLAIYSDYAVLIDQAAVTGTAMAVDSLVLLANSLPDTGGLFSSETSLEDFGKDLADFGKEFYDYYEEIQGIDVTKMSQVISQSNRLVDMARDLSTVDSGTLSTFADAISDLADAGIDDFIKSFEGGADRAIKAISTFIAEVAQGATTNKPTLVSAFTGVVDGTIESIEGQQHKFKSSGENSITNFVKGMTNVLGKVRTTITNILNSAAQIILIQQPMFRTQGERLIEEFIAGIQQRYTNLSVAITIMMNNMLTKIRDYEKGAYSAGEFVAIGFANGVWDNVYRGELAGEALGEACLKAIKDALREASPSKATYEAGAYAGIGLANALYDYTDAAYNAGYEMGDSAYTGVADTIAKIYELVDSNIDLQPTIRPVIDLTNVRSGVGQISSMFSRTRALNISSDMNAEVDAESQNGVTAVGNNYNFYQYNTSPKALASIDIYRQTNNQFSRFKRMVEST